MFYTIHAYDDADAKDVLNWLSLLTVIMIQNADSNDDYNYVDLYIVIHYE